MWYTYNNSPWNKVPIKSTWLLSDGCFVSVMNIEHIINDDPIYVHEHSATVRWALVLGMV